jgi:hypothetical protein
MDKVLELDWVGKRFVYKSKYGGETFGTITNVGIQRNCAFDYKTLLQLDKDLDAARKESKSGHKVDPITEYNITQNARKNPAGWSGFRPEVFIVSEKGNKYMLNEIFILNGKEK